VWKDQVEQGKDALLAAQISRDAACASKGPQCDAANAQVNAAQSALDATNQQLTASVAPPTATDLAQAQAGVNAAQQDVQIAKRPYTDQDIAQQQANVTAAQQDLKLAQQPNSDQEIQQQRDQLAAAQAALQSAQQPYSAQEVAGAQAAVDAAQGALTQAQQPYTDQDAAQAQAAVEQAQAQLNYSQAALNNANLNQSYTTLTAPYAGTVLEENAQPGEAVGPNGATTTTVQTTGGDATSVAGNAAMLLSSDDGLAVNVSIAESDISRIQLGQDVAISFDAYPGKHYQGKVTFVPHQGNSVQNVQEYIVKVAISPDASLPPPKPGMTANCVLTFHKDNVLTVPNAAVFHDANGQPVVVIKDGSASRNVHVQTGVSDASNTEVVTGLKEGDQVLMGPAAAQAAIK